MTTRKPLLFVAVIVAAILTTPIIPANAATKFCDVMPERCRWASDGVRYYYLPGQKMPTGIPGPGGVNRDNAPASSRATSVSAAPGAWGCGATDGTATGRSWNFRNKTAASYRALAECTQRSKTGGCHVVSCSASVRTYDDAHVAWFTNR